MNFPAASGFLTSTALVTGVALVAFVGVTVGFLTSFTLAAAAVAARVVALTAVVGAGAVVVVVVVTGVVVGFGWE